MIGQSRLHTTDFSSGPKLTADNHVHRRRPPEKAGRAGETTLFVTLYNPANRFERTPTWSEESPDGRWRAYTYDEIIARDKASLDIFWLKDESLEDSANLPEPGIILRDIIEDLQGVLEQLKLIAEDVGEEA